MNNSCNLAVWKNMLIKYLNTPKEFGIKIELKMETE